MGVRNTGCGVRRTGSKFCFEHLTRCVSAGKLLIQCLKNVSCCHEHDDTALVRSLSLMLASVHDHGCRGLL